MSECSQKPAFSGIQLAIDESEDRLLTPKEAATYLGRSVDTLKNWRWLRKGPTYFDDGRIYYRLSDLRAWREAHRVNGTVEALANERLLQQQSDRRRKDHKHPTVASQTDHTVNCSPRSEAAPLPSSSATPRKRRLYHRITNWERAVLEQARTSEQQAV